jgi:hypothetical protein
MFAVLAVSMFARFLEEINAAIYFCVSSLATVDFDVVTENSVLSGLPGPPSRQMRVTS